MIRPRGWFLRSCRITGTPVATVTTMPRRTMGFMGGAVPGRRAGLGEHFPAWAHLPGENHAPPLSTSKAAPHLGPMRSPARSPGVLTCEGDAAMKTPGPDHPITIEAARNRWRARFAGHVIAARTA